jgi:hypothetical protein
MATTGQKPFTRFQSLLTSLFDSQPFPFPANRNREDCPHWLLALTISFSRSDRARTDPIGVGAGLSRRTVPDVLLLLESLLRTPEGLGAYPAGVSPYQVRPRGSTRSGTKRPNPGRHPGPTARFDGTGGPAPGRGYPAAVLTWAFRLRGTRRHHWWCAVSHSGPPHTTPVSGAQQAFRSPLCAKSEPPRRACAACGPPRPTAWHLRA